MSETEEQSGMAIQPTAEIDFVGHQRRGSIYDGVFQEMAKLEPGQSLLLPLNGLDAETARNRINAAVRRAAPAAPAGYRWSMRITTDQKIAITPVKVRKTKAKSKAKPKARSEGASA